MHSFLTQELIELSLDDPEKKKDKKYLIYNKNCEDIKNNRDIKDNKNNIEYSLNIHTFNPTKNSPPNDWQYRLLKRINSLKSFNLVTSFDQV